MSPENFSMYRTDLDYNIVLNADWEQLLNYIQANFGSSWPREYTFARRAALLRVLCKMLNISPSNEQWVFILADNDRLLCEAGAGAGKTTMSQIKLVDEKLTANITGREILSIAYNHHSVEDMVGKHRSIMSQLHVQNIPELRKDMRLCCFTFHAFCNTWVEEYKDRFNLRERYTLDAPAAAKIMKRCIETYVVNTGLTLEVSDALVANFASLYGFTRETMTVGNPAGWVRSSAYSDILGRSIFKNADIETVFQYYDRYKQMSKKLDFSDQMSCMLKLCGDREVVERLRRNYRVILVDEYQDITPVMLRILNIITEADEGVGVGRYAGKFIAIGDGDQAIYGFRGTDSDNCIRFREDHPGAGAKIVSMSENRRCRENIIEIARKVIEANPRRIDKPIRGLKPGGEVLVRDYESLNRQYDDICSELRVMSPESLREACICYRNLSSSHYIGTKLLRNGIPFRVGSGFDPHRDQLSVALDDALYMLQYPDTLEYAKRVLYKLVPKSADFTKLTIGKLVDASVEMTSKDLSIDRPRFWELDFGAAVHIRGFQESMDTLRTAHVMLRNRKYMRDYVPHVIKLLNVYFLNWQRSRQQNTNDEYINYVTELYTQTISYMEFMEQRRQMEEKLQKERDLGNGVYITSFHGLKGLEFDTVYAVDLNDMIFPGTDLTANKSVTNEQKESIENETLRLLYVAVTRARDRFVGYFDKDMPCRYRRFFVEENNIFTDYLKAREETGEVSPTSEFLTAEDFADVGGAPQQDGAFLDDVDFDIPQEGDTDVPWEDADPLEVAARKDAADRDRIVEQVGITNYAGIQDRGDTVNGLMILLERMNSIDE